jgi:alkyl sulfatase BDS1-like metallo-beta-lactamase superfamily hydrolase
MKQALARSVAVEEPREATEWTREANSALLKKLPFDDTQAFEDIKKGFLAPLADGGLIKNDQGRPIYDLSQFAFIKEGQPAPDTVNPSLWRQAQLIMKGGLFLVTAGIYQVRAADLSNITFIEGEEGIVVVDPLISAETAKASLDLYYQNRPEKKPVVAVIYSHSHVDHFGGVRGIVSEEDVKSGNVKILAPAQFLEHTASEFVFAGNAMSRRASYMYGSLLPADPKGQVGAGLGPTTSVGTITLIPPTDVIRENGEKRQLAGLTFEFWMAPNSEASAEMFFYIPEKKALCTAEDATHTLHNTYTLRGAKIRDPLAWSKYLNDAIHHWGGEAEVLYAPHHWPVWGNGRVVEHLKKQRDLYRYINDQSLRLLNHGYTMIEIAEMLRLPASLENTWSARGYYGSLNHDVKSAYVNYLGWFDGNPATLHELPPAEASRRYVEFMGGAEAVLAKAKTYYETGESRWVAQVVNHVVFADPGNQPARNLQADALEQLGYQAESGPWRNFYLTGARELREGIPKMPAPMTASPDSIRAMSLDLLLDFVGTRLNGPKAAGKTITLNVKFTDTNEQFVVGLENGALNSMMGAQAEQSDATITLTHAILEDVLLGRTSPLNAITSGKIRVEGAVSKLAELASLFDTFDFWFNIVTPNTANQ